MFCFMVIFMKTVPLSLYQMKHGLDVLWLIFTLGQCKDKFTIPATVVRDGHDHVD